MENALIDEDPEAIAGEELLIERLLDRLQHLVDNPNVLLSGREREICERVLCGEIKSGDTQRCRSILQNHCTDFSEEVARG